MNRELFLSILAMDAYNRGYAPSVAINSARPENIANDIGRKIGNATLISQSDVEMGSSGVNAGFYALAYDLSGADIEGLTGTVISYRGTTYEANGSALSNYRDIWNGWLVGAGLLVDQSKLALEFYKRVNNNVDAFDLTSGSNITLTGHSLGGGLSGYVSTITGSAAIGYDYMPFMAAALRAWLRELAERRKENGYPSDSPISVDELAFLNLRLPNYKNFNGISLQGEILARLRDGSAVAVATPVLSIPAGLTGVGPIIGPLIDRFGRDVSANQREETALLGNQARTVSTYDWDMPSDPSPGVPRHSMAALVISLFAEQFEKQRNENRNWRAGGFSDAIYDALFDAMLARALPEAARS